MTEPLFASVAPVFTVGGAVHGELLSDLVRLEVDEATDGLKTLTARFLAYGPRAGGVQEEMLHLDGRIFDFGKSLDVAIGPRQNPRTIFRGSISAIEADFDEGREPEVVVFAEDRLMSLRMTRRMRTYENRTDAEIAREIASLHQLACEADADGPRYEAVQQWNMSDLAFLRERARLIQAEIWFQGDTLHFKTRERRSGTAITLVRGNHVLALQVRADLAHQRTGVRVGGYDARNRAGIEEQAGGEAIQAEVTGGRTGPATLARAFGDRVSYRVREVPLMGPEAEDWARAEMLRRSRAFVRAVGVTRGTPDLVVGSRLTLEGIGRPFQGRGYYVTRVRHTYDLTDGHRTHFEAERPTIEENP